MGQSSVHFPARSQNRKTTYLLSFNPTGSFSTKYQILLRICMGALLRILICPSGEIPKWARLHNVVVQLLSHAFFHEEAFSRVFLLLLVGTDPDK